MSLPRLIAITAEGAQRSAVEPILNALSTRQANPLFSKIHYGATIEDFVQINEQENGALLQPTSTEPLIVIMGAPTSPQVLEFMINSDKEGKTRDRIKLVHCLWTGVDGFQAPLLRKLLETEQDGGEPKNKTKIPLSNARGVYSHMLAEHVLLSILYFTRQVPLLQANRKNKIWDRISNPTTSKMNLLVAGFGEIGKCCAKRAVGGLDMNVIGVRSQREGEAPKPEEKCQETGARVVFGNDAMDALLPEADVVLAVLPNTPQTQKVFDAKRLAKFKKGAIFINIGRGHTVDDEALVNAVQSNHLGGLALDVFEKEPLPQDSKLWDLDDTKFLFTPHNADVAPTMFADSANFFATEIAEKFVVEGKLPDYLVDLKRGY